MAARVAELGAARQLRGEVEQHQEVHEEVQRAGVEKGAGEELRVPEAALDGNVGETQDETLQGGSGRRVGEEEHGGVGGGDAR